MLNIIKYLGTDAPLQYTVQLKVNIPTMLFFSQAPDVSDVAGVKRKTKCHHLDEVPKY